ncbi:ABC transporter ATP-binding protein [Vallitalea okinawensis]|uniref:ABC transporter ATP-binding protein n=1 Tax=Vallitalea okinawensis TaxID=2078660 RepID=UPI000CFAABDC|nr:ABC transporter ATP-binding protein [Vallitalea okinawensis]
MQPLLEVKNICKRFDNFELKNINFSLEPGYIMGLIGENGAGKTTTLKSILGSIHLDAGEVKVIDKEKIGFIIGENAYYELLSIKQMAKIFSKFYKNWDNQLFQNYLNRFELDAKQEIRILSRGMKVKFMLSCALSHGAELLILDEPTTGLDPVSRVEILEILQEIIQDGTRSILFSTHITSDLERISDYITFINKGEMVFTSEKDRLLNDFKLVKGKKDQLPMLIEKGYLDAHEVNTYGFTGLTQNASILKRNFGDDILIENSTIEDIMVHLVKHFRQEKEVISC